MSALIILLSPAITSALTGLIKLLPPFAKLTDQARTPIIRVLGAFIALAYVVAGMYITGSVSPDALANAVNAVIFAALAWLGSLGIFHAFFQKVSGVSAT